MQREILQNEFPKELKGESQSLDRKVSGGSTPKPRFKHVSFLKGLTFYLYGGTGVPCTQPLESSLQLHWVELGRTNLRWERGRLKCASKDLQSVSGLAVAGKDIDWYFFGGSNGEFRCNNHLWRMNLDTLEMMHLSGSGDIPAPRESASMVLLESWLLLYGGVNTNQLEIYNSMHCYSLNAKTWTRITGTYLNQICPRHDTSLCHLGDSLYLFGGTYRSATQNHQMYLNDFYRIKPIFQGADSPPALEVKRIQSEEMPEARSGHCLVPLGEQHLLLVGGDNSKAQVRDGVINDGISLVLTNWVYNIPSNRWSKVVFPLFKPRTCVSSCYRDGKVYIYGGLHSYAQILNDLNELSVSAQQLAKVSPLPSCRLCSPPLQAQPMVKISADLLEQLGEDMEFPFSAVGMLVDNAVLEGATLVNIIYEKGRKGVLRVEDNARLPWSEEQFISTMANFKLDAAQMMSGIEKKTRTTIIRENQRRQFGTYSKLASLRLGSGFLHVSQADDCDNNQYVRVSLFSKDLRSNCYTLKYYSCHKETGEVTNPQMESTKKEISALYASLIREATQRHYVRNTIFVLEVKIKDWTTGGEDEVELKALFKNNDIVCGSVAKYTQLEELGYNVQECVDLSLRAYLVSLYLKNQLTKISLGVGCEGVPIAPQIYLERLDKLKKHKQVLEVTNLMEFDVKIFELYYLYDLTKRVNYFSNGILIYHKNRLITRFKHPLGSLTERPHYNRNCNFLRFFGFVELPDHVHVNPLKTNVTYQIMLHKLYTRFASLETMIEQNLRKLHGQGPLKRLAPTKQSMEELRQDLQQNSDVFKNRGESAISNSERERLLSKKSGGLSEKMEVEQGEKEEKSPEEKVLEDKNDGSVIEEEECQIKVFLPIGSSSFKPKIQQNQQCKEESQEKRVGKVQPNKEMEGTFRAKVSFPIKIIKGINSSQKQQATVNRLISEQVEQELPRKEGEENGNK